MLRRVCLPAGVTGRLYLYSMPGRYEPFEEFLFEARCAKLEVLVCVATEDEVRSKSPSYFDARSNGSLPFRVMDFPMKDMSAPFYWDERLRFGKLVTGIALDLRAGRRVLVHCRMGIGRTGTTAACVLVALGLEAEHAITTVSAAGSHPQVPAQRELIAWYVSNRESER